MLRLPRHWVFICTSFKFCIKKKETDSYSLDFTSLYFHFHHWSLRFFICIFPITVDVKT